MKKAFSLIELMIVVAVLGILSAIAIPMVQGHVLKAKEANAAVNLREMRNAIELFSIKNDGLAPGYDAEGNASSPAFTTDLVGGGYMSEIPANPFNDAKTVYIIADGEVMPAVSPGGRKGWAYKPETKEIRLDWKGQDSNGSLYFDY
jgi:prepilin-type N-terminal cleavage/methylation domain-containing protein